MMDKRRLLIAPVLLAVAVLMWGPAQGIGATPAGGVSRSTWTYESFVKAEQGRTTNAQRRAAAARAATARKNAVGSKSALGLGQKAAVLNPLGVPDYFGTTPNYAQSPLPAVDASGNAVPGTGIRKFVDSLPGLTAAGANDLGQFIPVASANTTMYPGSDYYVIALVRYTKKLHADLPATTLQGYVQCDPTTLVQLGQPQYLGPAIVARRDVAVRIKFINRLGTGTNGNLFLPVDTTVMGAGTGPTGQNYTQNRATLHLHGGRTPWISDGTPHQWTTPAGENTPYQEGVSVYNVPDMDGGHEPTGTLTFYYSNQQSARLMFYHDHAMGITRLNVYAGEAAPYILTDPVEQTLVTGGGIKANGVTVTVAPATIPTEQVPLVIQDKTFVPADPQLIAEDPTWDKAHWGGLGNLWLPHVYMPNQNPGDVSGINAMGRWDYNLWFYPPILGQVHGAVPNPLAALPGENAENPGTPNPSIVPESFMDTPLVNGTVYPYMTVQRKAYRFRILNACDDRMLNLQLYFAKSNGQMWSAPATMTLLDGNAGEVNMVPAVAGTGLPATYPTDGRVGGVPDPAASGPQFIQIGNEGGLLPSATVLPNTPVGYEYFRRTITVLNVTNKTLYLGPAERADVIVDFSNVPAGSKLILYNDAPAPMPAFDTRLDYFTGDGDQTSSGGAPDTLPGYGPNTRTIMQFQVGSAPAAPAFSLSNLQTGLKAAFAASQEKPIVPEPEYGAVYNTTYPRIWDSVLNDVGLKFTPTGQSNVASLPLQMKAIIEGFELDYGRMNAQLGGTLPNLGPVAGAGVPYAYVDPVTEVTTYTVPGTLIGTANDGTQIWRIDHMGVDTHAIHFHLFDVQLINRVALDGQVFLPDANESGWKETVRMNPGQDVIVALKPIAPVMPFKIGDSIRPLNPTMAINATWAVTPAQVNATGGIIVPAVVATNTVVNFGWEYVWHCHLLGHEEFDMMRPVSFIASPMAPTTLTATPAAASVNTPTVTLKWTNNATVIPVATNYVVQRSTNAAFTGTLVTTSTVSLTTFADNTLAASTRYYWRARAENAVAFSPWSNVVTAISPAWTPKAPISVTTGARTRTSIVINWLRPVGGAPWVTLQVQVSATSATTGWTTIRTLSSPTLLTYNWISLAVRNHRYYFRVIAKNAAGVSATSAVVSALTLP